MSSDIPVSYLANHKTSLPLYKWVSSNNFSVARHLFTQRINKLYKDLQKYIYIEIYKFKAKKIKHEINSLMWYVPYTGLIDDRGKRFNWRDLTNTNTKLFYNGPIYKEMTHIGEFSNTTEHECLKIFTLPIRYIYSLNPYYDLNIR